MNHTDLSNKTNNTLCYRKDWNHKDETEYIQHQQHTDITIEKTEEKKKPNSYGILRRTDNRKTVFLIHMKCQTNMRGSAIKLLENASKMSSLQD